MSDTDDLENGFDAADDLDDDVDEVGHLEDAADDDLEGEDDDGLEEGSEDELGYADALGELEGILEELEDDAIDIDVLADRVARASELIGLCRARIASARVQVDRIVADLEQLGDGDQPTLL